MDDHVAREIVIFPDRLPRDARVGGFVHTTAHQSEQLAHLRRWNLSSGEHRIRVAGHDGETAEHKLGLRQHRVVRRPVLPQQAAVGGTVHALHVLEPGPQDVRIVRVDSHREHGNGVAGRPEPAGDPTVGGEPIGSAIDALEHPTVVVGHVQSLTVGRSEADIVTQATDGAAGLAPDIRRILQSPHPHVIKADLR